MKTFATILALCLLAPVTAEANGSTRKRVVVEREVVREPEPLLALGILGHGLIISHDFNVDLFDIEERRRERFQRERHRGRHR